jgi:hypothetical protein
MVIRIVSVRVPRLIFFSGSVFISGSNPNSDWSDLPELKYPSEHRTERFFPKYYNMRRPQPKGLITQFSYGGPSFDVSLDSADLFGDVANVVGATVVIIKTGFSTHAIVRDSFFVSYLTANAPCHTRIWANVSFSSNLPTPGLAITPHFFTSHSSLRTLPSSHPAPHGCSSLSMASLPSALR